MTPTVLIPDFILVSVLEVNLLWAAHQVHHSAEEYNLTTALRQSAFQTFGGWVSES